MSNEKVIETARAAVTMLTELSEHAWTYRNTASALLNDDELAAVEAAAEGIDGALRRRSREASRGNL